MSTLSEGEKVERCAKKGLKVGLTLSFVASGVIAYVAPEYAGILTVVGVTSNTVWLWEL